MRRAAFLGLTLLIAGTSAAHSLVDIKMSVEAPSFAAARQRFSYRIVADDLANDNALGVVVTNMLPPSVSFVKASGSGWNCSESKLKVTCSAEQLTPGPNVITVDVTAPAASGPITDSVTVTSLGSVDANTGNDNASATTTIYDPAACPAATLQLLPVTANRLSWTPVANAKSYAIYAAVEGERTALVTTTTATSAAIAFERGNVEWHVEAILGGCPTVVSAPGHFVSAGHAAALAVSTFSRGVVSPSGLAVDANGDLFVADRGSQTIRLISHGAVTTMSGTPQVAGAADGRPAAFADPMGIVITPLDDFLFIADRSNHAVRLRYPGDANLGFVTTIGGALAHSGMTDGLAEVSRFSAPSAIAADSRGRLYVADTGNSRIRKMTSVPGYVGYYSIATFAENGLLNPAGVAVDGEEVLYVADTGNHTIRKFVNGVSTTLAGSNGASGSADGYGADARFDHPTAMALDARGNLFVCDTGNHTIRKVSPSGLVTTVAGFAGSAADADGVASSARFSSPGAIVIDSHGAIYIADTGNRRICVAQAAVPAGDRRRAVGR